MKKKIRTRSHGEWLKERDGSCQEMVWKKEHVYRILVLRGCHMNESSELHEQTGAGSTNYRVKDSRVTLKKNTVSPGLHRCEESLERTYCPQMLKEKPYSIFRSSSPSSWGYGYRQIKLPSKPERSTGCLPPPPHLHPWPFCGNKQGSFL